MTFKFKEIPTFSGLVHCVEQKPKEGGLIVTSGKMPAHTVYYDDVFRPVRLMCHDFKNKAYFSKSGNFVALVGFGTLNGEIQIWRTTDY